MKAFNLAPVAAALFALSAGMAQAAPVTTWTVGVNSMFDPALNRRNQWIPWWCRDQQWQQDLALGREHRVGQSGLDITNSPTTSNVMTNGPAVANISVTHTNQPITEPSLDKVNILSTLTLTPFAPSSSRPACRSR